MLKVALIGCGMVADQHLGSIGRIPDCEVVGVCDTEALMAAQLAERFHVSHHFSSVQDMLKTTRPDVVHITTPAQSHFPLGKLCLEAGCHVYLEKPFAVTADETEELLAFAAAQGLKMTAGHNLQFSPEAIRMRRMVRDGFLGGPPIHLDCIQCFTHDEPTYGKALLGDPTHWVRRLPGSLLHNLISHGIAKIAEFLQSERPIVQAHVWSSPFLKRSGQVDIVDELRAIIHDGTNTTAYFTFSTQFGAASNQLYLYGPKASLLVDSTNRMLVPQPQTGYKSYLRYFLAPISLARQHRRNSWWNLRQFLRRDFHMDYGMKMLIETFYRSIRGTAPVPIPYSEILTTARLMDEIFAQIPKRT